MLHQNTLEPSTSLGNNTNSAHQSSVLSDGVLLSHSQPTREELKQSFETREGVYRNVPPAEITRPRPLAQYHMSAGMASAATVNQIAASGAAVRVSFLNLAAKIEPSAHTAAVTASAATTSTAHDPYNKKEPNGSSRYEQEADEEWTDKICFNVGKELYVYSYRGTHTEADLSRPIDKRVYKGTSPTFHAFNQDTANPNSCQLIIGFSLGQLQIIDPLEKASSSPLSKLYNEDRFIDKTAVTCIRWLPGAENKNIFLASYVSGNIYVYDADIQPTNSGGSNNSSQGPPWVQIQENEKYSIYGWKARAQPRNPVLRWKIGEGAIHQFNFSGPDAKMMATVGHDGFLRVFNYHSQELIAVMKSYFGGLLSLSWSPDAKYIATGGEDDLLTLYSVYEKRVVCRGQGHKSWISQVQFDPYLCVIEDENTEGHNITTTTTMDDVAKEQKAGPAPSTSADLNAGISHAASTFSRCSIASFNTIGGAPPRSSVCYRIGSVGHDTFLCLWDITHEMLVQQNVRRHRNSTIYVPMTSLEIQTNHLTGRLEDLQEVSPGGAEVSSDGQAAVPAANNGAPRPEKKKKRFAKRAFNFAKFGSSSSSNANSAAASKPMNGTIGAGVDVTKRQIPTIHSQISCCVETQLLGSKFCPGIRDVPIFEPLICKKVSHDRLTTLEFREDCVVTACQEGYICTWGRPGRWTHSKRDAINSPGTVSPESGQKQSTSNVHSPYAYGPDMSNGVPPSRSSSSYSNKL